MTRRFLTLAAATSLMIAGISCDKHSWSVTSKLFKHGEGHGKEHKELDDHPKDEKKDH